MTTTNADTLDGIIQGLLYVPDITSYASCDTLQYDFIPPNVTRRSDLPPTNYNLIALAPWFSIDCTQAYLAAARFDPVRAFVFYKPNNSSNKPQDVDSPIWNLDDDGAWKSANRYPVFAVPGLEGQQMMDQLSLYSGNVTEIPHGQEITELYGPNPSDYVRIWTELQMKNPSNMLALWTFFLIVIGSLLFIITLVSLTMHLIQRRRRRSLQQRVESGEVDLEASGIKRLAVPASHVKEFPLYTYNAEPDVASVPVTPSSVGAPMSTHSVRSSRSRKSRRRHHDSRSVISDIRPPGSIRSKRSSLGGSVDTTATNFQPNCHICLVRFEHRLSIIRELPCGHIFHPECIDEFLTENSSLCPMCKHCMLPRGYSPKITNAMVRRERALRRLRGRVDLDEFELEAGEAKIKLWKKRLFSSSVTSTDTPMAMASVKQDKNKNSRETSDQRASIAEESTDSTAEVPEDPLTLAIPEEPEQARTTESTRTPRPRKKRPRALRLLPTQPENSELTTAPVVGRKSPSSFARERMRAIAAKNAPFDDPDGHRPKCESLCLTDMDDRSANQSYRAASARACFPGIFIASAASSPLFPDMDWTSSVLFFLLATSSMVWHGIGVLGMEGYSAFEKARGKPGRIKIPAKRCFEALL